MVIRSITILFIFIFIWSCKDTSGEKANSAKPSITGISMPLKWNITSHQKKKIEVNVSNTSAKAISFSVKRVTDGEVVFQDSLYDDAGYFHPDDGDVAAGDAYYSNRFFPSEIISGMVEKVSAIFEFIAVSDNGKDRTSVTRNVEFLKDALPDIIQVSAPDSIKSGVEEVMFEVTALDSDGVGQIKSVFFEGHAPGSRIMLFRDTLAYVETILYESKEAAIYRGVRDSTLGAGKFGYYDLHFFVMDEIDELNETIPVRQIFIENKNGEILTTRLPEEIERPKKFPVEATVTDPQGLHDIEAVYFQTIKPDGTFGSNGAFFDMRDTGEAFYGDQEAGDGIYSKLIQVEEKNDPGIYKFHFFMRDKAGNMSKMKLDSILIK